MGVSGVGVILIQIGKLGIFVCLFACLVVFISLEGLSSFIEEGNFVRSYFLKDYFLLSF